MRGEKALRLSAGIRRWSVGLAVWGSCALPGVACTAKVTQEPGSDRTSAATPPSLAPVANTSPTRASNAIGSRLAPYPRARWRWVAPHVLDRVMLWPSHILIQHEGVEVLQTYFSRAPRSSASPARRTRVQALALAQQVAGDAREHPRSFASLARRYSEDRSTREQGGALGALVASDFRDWPQLLDAMAALRPGESSEVVETEFGFHILQRREPPAERVLGGSHIVIGYDEATWLSELVWRRPVPKRSRAEALALVSQIHAELQAAPQRFGELAQRHSEYRDGLWGGDFGAWSTREYGSYRRQRQQLEKLAVGAIAPPLETIFGFELIQRTERPRARYAAAILQLRYDPDELDPSHPRSAQAVWRDARALADLISREPERFDELRARHCCQAPLLWTEGQELSDLALALPALRVGQFAREPVAYDHSVLVVQRLDAASVWKPPPTMSFELPAPVTPDLAYLWSRTSSSVLNEQLHHVAERAAQAWGLDANDRMRLLELSRVPPSAAPPQPARRRASVATLRSDLEAWLGPERYQRYVDFWGELYANALPP